MDEITFRLKSFSYEILSLGLFSIIGYIQSSDFKALFDEHFGMYALGSVGYLLLMAGVKELRNFLTNRGVFGSDEARTNRI